MEKNKIHNFLSLLQIIWILLSIIILSIMTIWYKFIEEKEIIIEKPIEKVKIIEEPYIFLSWDTSLNIIYEWSYKDITLYNLFFSYILYKDEVENKIFVNDIWWKELKKNILITDLNVNNFENVKFQILKDNKVSTIPIKKLLSINPLTFNWGTIKVIWINNWKLLLDKEIDFVYFLKNIQKELIK